MARGTQDTSTPIDRLDVAHVRDRERTRPIPIDVYRLGAEYVVEMELPGIDPSDVTIRAHDNVLSVTARVRSRRRADERILCERSHAPLTRQLHLDDNLDAAKITVQFDNGVLTIRLAVPSRATRSPASARTSGRTRPNRSQSPRRSARHAAAS
ncbi:MAG: Hsp20/alpha crystallin family protein [Acidimicrobiia bacterium]